MRYHEAAGFLFDLRRYGPRPGTEATAALLAELGDPHRSVPVVQVAGSNGKGSTARMVESVLREAGLSVGLYTSPHLDDVRERVRVDGRKIPEAAVCEFVSAIREYALSGAARGDSPTFFEALTAMAYWEFDRRDADVAVVEVGIGGRHDATSVADPVAAAVTTVTLEHTDVLGETIPAIARDKAAVAPAGRPLVTGATGEALAAVREDCEVLTVANDDSADVLARYDGLRGVTEAAVSLAGPDWGVDARIPLPGAYQARNAGVAATLARQVGDELGRLEAVDAALGRGLRNAAWPGRFEVIDREPLTVLDGAHNPGACEAVAETLAGYDYGDLHLVVGALTDKDHADMAAALPTADRVVACRPDVDRAESAAVLARVFEGTDATEVVRRGAVEDALADALAAAGADDLVLVTGSLYTVAEARQRWTRIQTPARIRDLGEAEAALERAHVTEAGVRRMRGKAVQRTLRTRVQVRQARYLKEELLALGGECALSGLSAQDEERVDAVLAGTLEQFRQLTERLADQPYGLSELGAEIRRALGIRYDPPTHGYPWEEGTAVMGILNVTPDSFHDGGRYEAVEDAVARAEEMVAAGADVIDVGGESTRPGADPIPVAEEKERAVPVIERIADADALVSVDTRKAEVARTALAAGADAVNDVSGLEDPEMARVAAEYGAPLVVMHSLDAPVDPDADPEYDDVVGDVLDQLREPVLRAERAGLPREKIVVDPGLGFGKSAAESFELLDRLGEFEALGCPVLVGHSHKSMFGAVGRYPDEGGYATVAATALAAERGADLVRVHDVAENVAAVRTAAAARAGTDRDRG